MSGRVLVVGSANVDVVLRLDRLPAPGETALAERPLRGYGGKGANQAVAAAGAGAQVALLGRVGDDAEGAAYRERLARLGVDVEHLLVTPGHGTGTAYVLVDARGENAIVVTPGANSAVRVADLAPVVGMGAGDVLLLQCELPAGVVEQAARIGRAAGARVVLNLAPYADLPDRVLALADPVVVNEHEAQRLADRPAAPASADPHPQAPRPPSLLVTRGPAGATWGSLSLPAVPVDPADVVDTTGAGDAFCGVLAAALAAGLDHEAALRAALAAGAAAVQRAGAQPEPEPLPA